MLQSRTWLAQTCHVGLRHPLLSLLFQLEDDIRFGVLISCGWEITDNLIQNHVGLRDSEEREGYGLETA